MKRMVKYFILVVVILIILMFSAYRCGQNRCEMDFLQGFWESNTEFNKESGIQSFTLYIGDKCNGRYPAYLLMVESGNEQTLLINEPTSFTLSEPYINTFSRNECKEMYLRFENMETDLLPCVMTMKFYPQTCKIVLADHKKIYAVFFKNPVLSEMERIKKEKELQSVNTISIQSNLEDMHGSLSDDEKNMSDVE